MVAWPCSCSGYDSVVIWYFGFRKLLHPDCYQGMKAELPHFRGHSSWMTLFVARVWKSCEKRVFSPLAAWTCRSIEYESGCGELPQAPNLHDPASCQGMKVIFSALPLRRRFYDPVWFQEMKGRSQCRQRLQCCLFLLLARVWKTSHCRAIAPRIAWPCH